MISMLLTGFGALADRAPEGDAGASDATDAVPPVYQNLLTGHMLLARDATVVTDAAAVLGTLLSQADVIDDEWELRPLDVRTSPMGTHHRFQFEAAGLPLFGHSAALHVDGAGRAWFATQSVDDALPAAPAVATADLMSSQAAQATAGAARAGDMASAQLGWRLDDGALRPMWRLDVVDMDDGEHAHDTRIWVDALSGVVTATEDRLVQYASGEGLVFAPSPTVSAQNFDVLDVPGGGPAPWLEAARVPVQIEGLSDDPAHQGHLIGQYSTVDGTVDAPDLDFSYSRTQLEFQEVMVYHYTDNLQRFIQGLGFNDVNNESQHTGNANLVSPLPNAYYSPSADSTTFISHSWVTANTDAAEDAEVIIHENGHAIQYDQVPDWGDNYDQGSMGEGFSDFLAAAFLTDLSGGFGDACMSEWFASHVRGAYADLTGPACIRNLDNDYTYSEMGYQPIHTAGQIWSGLLYDLWQEFDRDYAVGLSLAGHFLMDGGADMAEAADMLILADREMHGGAHEMAIASGAHDREIAGPLALWILGLPGGDPDPYDPPGNGTASGFVYRTEEILPVDINTTGWTEIDLGDDQVEEFAIPSTPFFGNNTTRLHVSSNGFIALGDYDGDSGCCSGGPIPEDDHVNGIIAGAWTDLNPTNCDSRISMNVTDEWVTVAYENVTYYGESCSPGGGITLPILGPLPLFGPAEPTLPDEVTVWMRISPVSGDIEVHLLAVDGGGTATTGIEHPSGTTGNETRRTADALSEPVAWRFTPLGLPEGAPEPEPEPEGYVLTRTWEGFLACSVGAAGSGVAVCSLLEDPNDEFLFQWEALPSVRELVVGLRWEASSNLDDELSLYVEHAFAGTNAEGTSPLIATASDSAWGQQGNESFRLRVFACCDVGAAFQLPFEVVIEEYHFQNAPEGRNPFEPLP